MKTEYLSCCVAAVADICGSYLGVPPGNLRPTLVALSSVLVGDWAVGAYCRRGHRADAAQVRS